MAFPAGPWMRVITNFTNGERNWQNDIWYKLTAVPGSGTNVVTVASSVNMAISGAFAAWMPTTCTYLGIDVYLNNGTYTVGAHIIANTPGTGGTKQLPNEDAAIVTLNCGVGTRIGVGRVFVGGVDETNTSASRVTSAGLTLLNNIATALKGVTNPGGISCVLAVWSRKTNAIDVVQFTTSESILGHRKKRRPRR